MLFVKMIKGINRDLGVPGSPSFLLEVQGRTSSSRRSAATRSRSSCSWRTAADRIHDQWRDPAVVGPERSTSSEICLKARLVLRVTF